MLVMLRKNWNGTFGRSVRDADGEILRRLTFAPGEPVRLNEEELAAVARDIELGTLVPCEQDPKGRSHEVKTMAKPAKPSTPTRGKAKPPKSNGKPPAASEGNAPTRGK